MTDWYKRSLYAEDVSVGDTGPEIVVEDIGVEDFVRYAGASGDFNPLHYDQSYAEAAGEDSVFGQGMLTANYAAHLATDWFGLDRIDSFSVRFRDRLWPDDTVTVSGEIVEVADTPIGAEVEADLVVTNQDGTELVTGNVTATLPEDDDAESD